MNDHQQLNTIIHVYTDGACKGNPGPGGWGTLIVASDQVETELYGGEMGTTNNRMELMAVIKALEHFSQPQKLLISLDSEYVRRGITDWIIKWRKNGWRTVSKQPVKNADLWKQLDKLVHEGHVIEWQWVKGHSGHPSNERADALANKGAYSTPYYNK